MKEIKLSDSRIRTFVRKQYRNIVLKQALKLFSGSRLWTIPSDSICQEALLNGFYERELLEGMCLLVKNKTGTCLDVGANIGNHSIYFSEKFAYVVSFEAHPRNVWILKANIHYNQIENIRVVDHALGDAAGIVDLDDSNPKSTNSGVLPSGQSSDCKVKAVKGDDVLCDLDVPPIAMIKVDVEGWEPQVLRGLSETIKKDRPIVFWEAFTAKTVAEGKTVLEELGCSYFYHISRPSSSIGRALKNSVYLRPLDECTLFEGLNVGSFKPL